LEDPQADVGLQNFSKIQERTFSEAEAAPFGHRHIFGGEHGIGSPDVVLRRMALPERSLAELLDPDVILAETLELLDPREDVRFGERDWKGFTKLDHETLDRSGPLKELGHATSQAGGDLEQLVRLEAPVALFDGDDRRPRHSQAVRHLELRPSSRFAGFPNADSQLLRFFEVEKLFGHSARHRPCPAFATPSEV
jgi:hypothetical protein